MSAASDYTEKNVLNSMLRGVTYPLPSKVFVSLHTASPTDSGGGEVTTAAWPSYARVDAADGGAIATGWSVPGNGAGGVQISRNTNQILYEGMNGSGPITVTHWALYDAATGGNLLCHAPLNTSRTLQVGDVFIFDRNSIEITMA